jgi:hypothetical protein
MPRNIREFFRSNMPFAISILVFALVSDDPTAEHVDDRLRDPSAGRTAAERGPFQRPA